MNCGRDWFQRSFETARKRLHYGKLHTSVSLDSCIGVVNAPELSADSCELA